MLDPVGLAIYGHIQSYLRKDYKTGLELPKAGTAGRTKTVPGRGDTAALRMIFGRSLPPRWRTWSAVRLSPVGPDAFGSRAFLLPITSAAATREYLLGADIRRSQRGIAANQRLMASLPLADYEARRMAAQVQRITPNFRLSAFSVGDTVARDGERTVHRSVEGGRVTRLAEPYKHNLHNDQKQEHAHEPKPKEMKGTKEMRARSGFSGTSALMALPVLRRVDLPFVTERDATTIQSPASGSTLPYFQVGTGQ